MTDDRFAVQRTQVTSVGRLRTALMLTDIVGYSRRMHADEARAVRELRKHNEVIRALLEAHHGREVKTMGDAFLAEFAVTDDALRCALAIHRKLEEVFIDEDPLRVRIGLHVAEVEAIGPDVIGDGVNILSRIEPQADPGGICASKEFVGECKAAEVLFTDMGPVEMKNISKPIELARWPSKAGELEELPATRVLKRTVNSMPAVPAASIVAAANLPRQAPDDTDEKTQMVSESQRPALSASMFVPSSLSDQPTPTRASALTALQSALPEPDVGTATMTARPISRSGPSSARPLSRSSGIFVPPHVEPEDATKVLRAAEETRDALGISAPSDEQTVTRSAVGPAKDWDMLLPARAPDANPSSMHDVGGVVLPPLQRSKTAVVALGVVAGGAVAMTLVVIIWMISRPAPVPEQVRVPPPQTVVPVAPQPPPPAPVAVAPTPPPTPAPAPTPAAVAAPENSQATFQQQFIAAVEKIQHSRQKPKQKKALLQKLDKLNKNVTRAKRAKDKKKAESAMRAFLRKNKLN